MGRRHLAAQSLAAGAAVGVLATAMLAAGGTQAAEPGEVQLRLDADAPAQGSTQAPVTMVEFTDYQCPYCRRFQAEVWPRLKREYVRTGRVRFVVLDLPLEFHPAALPAALAAHCAGEQGAFWPMHAALLANATQLGPADLEQQARKLRLDLGRFRGCMSTGSYIGVIERHAAQAEALGLRGTPAFVIGQLVGGELHGQVLMGARPYQDFAAALRQALAGSARTAARAGATTGAAGRPCPPPAALADAGAPPAARSRRS